MKLMAIVMGSVAAAAMAVACASPAFAEDITITKTSVNTDYTAHVSIAGGINEIVYASPVEFNALVGGVPQSFEAFCVDLFHNISLGSQSPPLQYHTAALTDGLTGHPITSDQAMEISFLADNYLKAGVSDLDKAAAQVVVWEDLGGSVTGLSSALSNEAMVIADSAGKSSTNLIGMYSNDGRTQGFTSAAPEPGTWALMLMGVAMLGGILRFNRRQVVAL